MTELNKPDYHQPPGGMFAAESMQLLKAQLAQASYPGYPTNRLKLSSLNLVMIGGDYCLDLPFGPWEINAFRDLPDANQRQDFKNQGYDLDACGRPLHPWAAEMALDPEIGVLIGKGAYYNWGPNYTADPLMFRSTPNGREILLIQRQDTGAWALPGGFVDAGETSFNAAIREAQEETGIDLTAVAGLQQIQVYDGPLMDLRITANAWPHTTAYKFDVSGLDLPEPAGNDDARDAAWVPVELCGNLLFGSHSLLVKMALEQ